MDILGQRNVSTTQIIPRLEISTNQTLTMDLYATGARSLSGETCPALLKSANNLSLTW